MFSRYRGPLTRLGLSGGSPKTNYKLYKTKWKMVKESWQDDQTHILSRFDNVLHGSKSGQMY